MSTLLDASCPVPISDHREVVLGHGSGGRLTQQLIEKMVLPEFRNPHLEPLHDGAVLPVRGARLAFSTDSYVINPIFFPGGDIGSLSVRFFSRSASFSRKGLRLKTSGG